MKRLLLPTLVAMTALFAKVEGYLTLMANA